MYSVIDCCLFDVGPTHTPYLGGQQDVKRMYVPVGMCTLQPAVAFFFDSCQARYYSLCDPFSNSSLER